MSSRRTAILIGAIAVGIMAVVLIWQYVRGIENNLYAESQPVSVFVAGAPIPRGTAGEAAVGDRSIVQGSVPQKYYPATAIASADEVQKKVALFDISPGTIIVRGMFVDPATTQISFRERLKNKTHVAISIQVDQIRGVGGFLVPGDEVNIMMTSEYVAADGSALPPAGTDAASGKLGLSSSARMLYQKVQVLAVGQTQLLSPGETAGDAAQGGANNTGLLTLNVPAKAAQLIASFSDKGLYLTLVPKDYVPQALPPLPQTMDRLPGETDAEVCPYFDTTTDSGCAKVG